MDFLSAHQTTALETEVVPTLNALAHRVLVVLNDVEKVCVCSQTDDSPSATTQKQH